MDARDFRPLSIPFQTFSDPFIPYLTFSEFLLDARLDAAAPARKDGVEHYLTERFPRWLDVMEHRPSQHYRMAR